MKRLKKLWTVYIYIYIYIYRKQAHVVCSTEGVVLDKVNNARILEQHTYTGQNIIQRIYIS